MLGHRFKREVKISQMVWCWAWNSLASIAWHDMVWHSMAMGGRGVGALTSSVSYCLRHSVSVACDERLEGSCYALQGLLWFLWKTICSYDWCVSQKKGGNIEGGEERLEERREKRRGEQRGGRRAGRKHDFIELQWQGKGVKTDE